MGFSLTEALFFIINKLFKIKKGIFFPKIIECAIVGSTRPLINEPTRQDRTFKDFCFPFPFSKRKRRQESVSW